MGSELLLISLPHNAAPSGGDPQTQLDKWISDNLTVIANEISQFDIPSFKIGTLDNLVQQSEELAKLDSQIHSIVSKAADIIGSIYEGADSKTAKAQISNAKRMDNLTPSQYFRQFKWNASKYRVDKSINELVDIICKELFALDSDMRTSYNSYSAANI